VVSRHFAHLGSTIIACEPQNLGLAEVLSDSGIRDAPVIDQWIPVVSAGQVTATSVAPAAIFGSERSASLEDFVEGLSSFARSTGFGKRGSAVIVGTANEFLHNVLSHGEAQNAAAVVIVFTRRRPRILQVGIADDGIGIPTSLVTQRRHDWVSEFSDALATRAVLRGALSGRPEDALGALTGGGVARIVQRLSHELHARVIMRSGAALVRVGASTGNVEINRLSYGHGTQVRIEVPIP
jgi:hypothetical protein